MREKSKGQVKVEVGVFMSSTEGLNVLNSEIDLLAAEQYRILYSKIEQISVKGSYKAFAVTSAVKGEGKTSVSINLSYIMAQEFGKKVILVECDLKNPSIRSHLPATTTGKGSGIAEVIKGEVDLHGAVIQADRTNLYLLPARGIVKNSSGLLSSPHMKLLLDKLKTEYDYIIIDSPPILPLADMNILSKVVDGFLLVVRAGKTPRDIVLKAVNSLSSNNLVGIVLNGAELFTKKYYYY